MRHFPKSLANPIAISHNGIRGRARIEVDSIYRDQKRAKKMTRKLAKATGITRVTANPWTGNLLILFNRDEVTLCSIILDIENIVMGRRPTISKKKIYWHTLDIKKVANLLQTDLKEGLKLSDDELRQRRKLFGNNSIRVPSPKSKVEIFINQFRNVPSGLLLFSAFLSIVSGGGVDALLILIVLLINNYIGYRMERTSQQVIGALLKEDPNFVQIVRKGELRFIDSETIVPGDLLVLVPGTLVPADARVIRSEYFSVDESILTGESLPVYKFSKAIRNFDTPLVDRANMVFKGCIATTGKCQAIVVDTGENTEIGKIQRLIDESVQPQTPMQKQLSRIGNQAATLSIVVSAAMMLIGIFRRTGLLMNLRTTISMAVAAIPEALPTIATTTLTRGVSNLKKHDVLIRSVDSLETLANVTSICFDKTGTLTLNQMEVSSIETIGDSYQVKRQCFFKNGMRLSRKKLNGIKDLKELIQVAILCNEARIEESKGRFRIKGSSTESALLECAASAGVNVTLLRKKYPTLATNYRSEGQNFMTTLHQRNRAEYCAIKGVPRDVLNLCHFYWKGNQLASLSEEEKRVILEQNEKLARNGLRVLGFASFASFAIGDNSKESDQHRGIWLGLVGMTDIIRPGIDRMVARLASAGIESRMITGDQDLTAQAIGRAIGVNKIYSRVSPSQKLEIIREMQREGKIVAMIGDGINDGPALKAANVGIAMAEKGAVAASQSADVVLPSDNLDGIWLAIREGRTIHDETKKAIKYIVSQNLSEILYTFITVAFSRIEPFTPLQFLWINLVTDLFPELALAQEPADADIMRRNPHYFRKNFMDREDIGVVAVETSILTGAAFTAYLVGKRIYGSELRAKSLAFLTVTASSLFYTYHSRSEYLTLFDRTHLGKNRYIPLAIAFGFIAEFAGVTVPKLRQLLNLEETKKFDVLLSTAGSLTMFLILEISMFVNRRIQQKV